MWNETQCIHTGQRSRKWKLQYSKAPVGEYELDSGIKSSCAMWMVVCKRFHVICSVLLVKLYTIGGGDDHVHNQSSYDFLLSYSSMWFIFSYNRSNQSWDHPFILGKTVIQACRGLLPQTDIPSGGTLPALNCVCSEPAV